MNEESKHSCSSEECDPRYLIEIEAIEVTGSGDDPDLDELSDMSNEDYNPEHENQDMSGSDTESKDSEHKE